MRLMQCLRAACIAGIRRQCRSGKNQPNENALHIGILLLNEHGLIENNRQRRARDSGMRNTICNRIALYKWACN